MVNIVIIILMLFSFKSMAFTLNNNLGATFSKDEVKINVADNSCDNIGITPSEILDIASEGIDKFWNTVSTSKLRLVRGAVTPVGSKYKTELICSSNNSGCQPNHNLQVSGDILIACNQNSSNFSGSTSVLGVTVINHISGSNILGSLFMINDMEKTAFANQSHAQKVAIIAHEIGHAFGLGHSPVKDSLMYYKTIERREALGWDDIDGITYLYPIKQPDVGCGTIQEKSSGSPTGQLPIFFLGLISVYIVGRSVKKISAVKAQ